MFKTCQEEKYCHKHHLSHETLTEGVVMSACEEDSHKMDRNEDICYQQNNVGSYFFVILEKYLPPFPFVMSMVVAWMGVKRRQIRLWNGLSPEYRAMAVILLQFSEIVVRSNTIVVISVILNLLNLFFLKWSHNFLIFHKLLCSWNIPTILALASTIHIKSWQPACDSFFSFFALAFSKTWHIVRVQ